MSGEALGMWLGYAAGKQEAEEKARIAAMSPKKRAAFYAERTAEQKAQKQFALDAAVTTGLFGVGMAASASDNPIIRTVGPVASAALPAAYVSWRAGWLKPLKKKTLGVRL